MRGTRLLIGLVLACVACAQIVDPADTGADNADFVEVSDQHEDSLSDSEGLDQSSIDWTETKPSPDASDMKDAMLDVETEMASVENSETVLDSESEESTDAVPDFVDGNDEKVDDLVDEQDHSDTCEPQCHERVCGDDGCGGSCGSCAEAGPCASSCVDGACVPQEIGDEVCGNGIDEDCDGYDAFCDVPEGTIAQNGCLIFGVEASDDGQGHAIASLGSEPWTGVTWVDADVACRASGYRLCSAEEWGLACGGASMRPYPYGETYLVDACNTEGGGTVATGAYPDCVTPEGVADLAGNVMEWVGRSSDEAATAGGYSLSGADATCDAVQELAPSTSYVTLGFRCCVRWDDDLDQDGVPYSADPDDSDPLAYPGAPERCNGIDDDGDGLTDAEDTDLVLPPGEGDPPQGGGEGPVMCENQSGACAGAAKPASLCVDGAWQACDAAAYLAHAPAYAAGDDTTCDGIDNDCDDLTDEDFGSPESSCGAGACASHGVLACGENGEVSDSCVPGEPATEDSICDGVDDDCDDLTDEDYVSVTTSCGVGACAAVGTTTCATEGQELDSCEAGEPALDDESCDGVDDDCDGLTDEDYVSVQTSCGVGACAAFGATSCELGQIGDSCVPSEPAFDDGTCDGLDDDCDDATDEDYAPPATTCGEGACAAEGALLCLDGGVTSDTCAAGKPGPELCNGIDDDCDGLTDAADDGLVLDLCEVQNGACSEAVHVAEQCANGNWLPCGDTEYVANDASYTSGSETACDGIDNDCDGATDDDFALTTRDGRTVLGLGAICGAGACGGGLAECNEAGTGLSCPTELLAASETCNGVDDDCDGRTDEDVSPTSWPCKDEGVCAGAQVPVACVDGSWSCTYALVVGYQADVETACDGKDNDCDGQTDEDFVFADDLEAEPSAMGEACGPDTCRGLTVCASDGGSAACTSTSGLELCDGKDNDCDDETDEGLGLGASCLGAGACFEATGVIECGPDGGTVCSVDANGSTPSGTAEICDTVDNDCDGQVDEGCPLLDTDNDGWPDAIDCGPYHRDVHPYADEPCCDPAMSANADAALAACDRNCDEQVSFCSDADADFDGVESPADCDDGDPAVFPGAPEKCGDEKDQDCDGSDVACDLVVDADGDGYSWPADCNDDAGDIHPWATELCNLVDDNCDGVVDDGNPEGGELCGSSNDGICTFGTTVCVQAGAPDEMIGDVQCLGSVEPSPDDATCNGLDDDCDGETDEDYAPVEAGCGIGACASVGVASCVEGVVQDSCIAGDPATNDTTCDGVDDDCNAETDEGYVAVETSCGLGACVATGVTSCVEGQVQDSCIAGTPGDDDATCDGIDDDCDESTDEDYTPLETACGTGACAGTGMTSCAAGQIQDSCVEGLPSDDDATCDGVDDDCDEQTDEDYPTVETTCGIGECAQAGILSCIEGSEQDSCLEGPQADESCNGKDDDCDGLTDEDCPATSVTQTFVSVAYAGTSGGVHVTGAAGVPGPVGVSTGESGESLCFGPFCWQMGE